MSWRPTIVRIGGTRIGIESILYEYIHRSQSPEEIAERFHTVSPQTGSMRPSLYYLHNRPQLDAYVAGWRFIRTAREAQSATLLSVIVRLRQRKAEQQAIS